MDFALRSIGVLRTCFPDKLGIPRQPGLASLARGVLHFSDDQPPAIWQQALHGLDGFAHVWITFSFHRAIPQGWKTRIRPPRLGGREKMGVFATRSPHRPNFLGMSLCTLDRVDMETPRVHVSGVDILDGTPVLDIRPFHPLNDLPIGEVRKGWIERATSLALPVDWKPGARELLEERLPSARERGMPEYSVDEAAGLVEQLVGLDPRPAHHRGTDGEWYLRVLSFDVHVGVVGGRAEIRNLAP